MDVNTYKTNVLGQQGQQSTTGTDAFQDLEMGDFLKLMIAELSNQDPMNPMDNSEMLQQLSQMSAIASNDKLTDTLDSVRLGQNMATASSMLGQVIRGLDDTGSRALGTIDRVSVAEEEGIRVHIGDQSIKLENIAEVFPPQTELDDIEWPTGSEQDNDEEDTTEDLFW